MAEDEPTERRGVLDARAVEYQAPPPRTSSACTWYAAVHGPRHGDRQGIGSQAHHASAASVKPLSVSDKSAIVLQHYC